MPEIRTHFAPRVNSCTPSNACLFHTRYNAQHRIATAYNNAIQYVYNALGQRVEKSVGGVAKYYLYDPAGQAVTVLDQSGNWLRGEIFAGARHIATYVNNTTDFDYSDWLGTERLTATLSGTEQDACTSLPYGDDFACSGPGSDSSPLHFTGQQHDNETGLDHFPGRNYTSTWATFTSPDPAPWNLSDPQTLDRYVYTADNPVTLTDPTGLTPCAGKSGAPCKVKNVVEEKHPGSSAQQQNGQQTSQSSTSNFKPNPGPAPTNPDGSPKAPNIPAPNDVNGRPTHWVPIPGSGKRPGVRWVPSGRVPSPNGKGGRPQVVWDPEDGYWTQDDGGGRRTHWDPNTGQQIIKATAAGAVAVGAGVTIWQILEDAAVGAAAF